MRTAISVKHTSICSCKLKLYRRCSNNYRCILGWQWSNFQPELTHIPFIILTWEMTSCPQSWTEQWRMGISHLFCHMGYVCFYFLNCILKCTWDTMINFTANIMTLVKLCKTLLYLGLYPILLKMTWNFI